MFRVVSKGNCSVRLPYFSIGNPQTGTKLTLPHSLAWNIYIFTKFISCKIK